MEAPSMKQHQIYIVEDHEMMREMMTEFLTMAPDLHVAGQAKTAESALEELASTTVHLLLIDVALPGMSGIELVSEVRNRWPGLPCLMYSGHGEIAYARRALENGANGYVLKGNPDELVEAIHNVLSGKKYVSAPLKSLPG